MRESRKKRGREGHVDRDGVGAGVGTGIGMRLGMRMGIGMEMGKGNKKGNSNGNRLSSIFVQYLPVVCPESGTPCT